MKESVNRADFEVGIDRSTNRGMRFEGSLNTTCRARLVNGVANDARSLKIRGCAETSHRETYLPTLPEYYVATDSVQRRSLHRDRPGEALLRVWNLLVVASVETFDLIPTSDRLRAARTPRGRYVGQPPPHARTILGGHDLG